jgi:hypothetical protein
MAKLANREKIILGIMAVAIIVAAYIYLFPKKKGVEKVDAAQKTAELNTFVATLSGSLKEDTMSDTGTLILARAEKEWERDPFLSRKDLINWNEAKAKKARADATAKVEFVYSGYFEVGRKKIAIINGVEYKEGEALDVPGYILKSVSPDKVVIENRGLGATMSVLMLE